LTKYSYGYILIIDSCYKGRAIKRSLIIENKTMPKFDGTGPLGSGPGTGRGMGPCGGGMGWRGGFGRGFGCRRFYTRKEESEILEEETKVLQEELKAVKERLVEIKGQK